MKIENRLLLPGSVYSTRTTAPLSDVTILTKELNACTDDIKTWMTENQLKLNDDKTEALLFPFFVFLETFYRLLP